MRFGTDDANPVLGLGSLALIRHEFRDALRYGRSAERLLPGSYRPYGVTGDALVELGRYDEAFAAFDRMISLRPSLASYARVAYARELMGDRRGALAAHAAGTHVGRGSARADRMGARGALQARAGTREAGQRSPAHDGCAPGVTRAIRARASSSLRSTPPTAIFAARSGRPGLAAEATPTAQAVALLGDLLERAGRPDAARRQRATVAVIDRLLAANGVRADLETAVVSRGQRDPAGRRRWRCARRARAARPSIYGDDALGWALARAGRCREAIPWLDRSLRLGTRDALLYFHRGYAERCAGDVAGGRAWFARALDLNAAFSVRWAPVARAFLSG